MVDVKEKQIEKLTITVESDSVDATLVTDLETLMPQDREAKTQLFFRIHDVEHNAYILLRSNQRMVNVNKPLIQYIEDHPKMSYQIN